MIVRDAALSAEDDVPDNRVAVARGGIVQRLKAKLTQTPRPGPNPRLIFEFIVLLNGLELLGNRALTHRMYTSLRSVSACLETLKVHEDGVDSKSRSDSRVPID